VILFFGAIEPVLRDGKERNFCGMFSTDLRCKENKDVDLVYPCIKQIIHLWITRRITI